ncbi:unnamed protein product, partial [Adineta ricciae]
MPTQSRLSLNTLSVELVYRILDCMDLLNIFWSLQCVSQRLNTILKTYSRYQTLETLGCSCWSSNIFEVYDRQVKSLSIFDWPQDHLEICQTDNFENTSYSAMLHIWESVPHTESVPTIPEFTRSNSGIDT